MSPIAYFNSRPCGRGDNCSPAQDGLQSISIHAPAGGATCRPTSTRCQQCLFQFTPLREGRPPVRRPPGLVPNFNSRPCGRGDLPRYFRAATQSYFNSRPCGRGDPAVHVGQSIQQSISIHAPAGGATPRALPRSRSTQRISIHAPAGGATHIKQLHSAQSDISIHAPAGGATNINQEVTEKLSISIHAPAGGATLIDEAEPELVHISIHAPAGGATL